MRNTLPREESTYEIFILDWKRKSWNKHFWIHIHLCHQMKGEIRCGLIINIITYVFIDTVGIPTHDCIYRIYWKYNLCRVSLYFWWWNHNDVPLPGYKKRPFFFLVKKPLWCEYSKGFILGNVSESQNQLLVCPIQDTMLPWACSICLGKVKNSFKWSSDAFNWWLMDTGNLVL